MSDTIVKPQNAFEWACENGNLERAKLLYEKYKTQINLSRNRCQTFRTVCSQNYRTIAEFLYIKSHEKGQEPIDIHAHTDEAFTTACEYGYLGLAKWLYETDQYSTESIDSGMRHACSNGRLELAMWLCSIGARVHAHCEELIRKSVP